MWNNIIEYAIGTVIGILAFIALCVATNYLAKAFLAIVKFLVVDLLLGAFHKGKEMRVSEINDEGSVDEPISYTTTKGNVTTEHIHLEQQYDELDRMRENFLKANNPGL